MHVDNHEEILSGACVYDPTRSASTPMEQVIVGATASGVGRRRYANAGRQTTTPPASQAPNISPSSPGEAAPSMVLLASMTPMKRSAVSETPPNAPRKKIKLQNPDTPIKLHTKSFSPVTNYLNANASICRGNEIDDGLSYPGYTQYGPKWNTSPVRKQSTIRGGKMNANHCDTTTPEEGFKQVVVPALEPTGSVYIPKAVHRHSTRASVTFETRAGLGRWANGKTNNKTAAAVKTKVKVEAWLQRSGLEHDFTTPISTDSHKRKHPTVADCDESGVILLDETSAIEQGTFKRMRISQAPSLALERWSGLECPRNEKEEEDDEVAGSTASFNTAPSTRHTIHDRPASVGYFVETA